MIEFKCFAWHMSSVNPLPSQLVAQMLSLPKITSVLQENFGQFCLLSSRSVCSSGATQILRQDTASESRIKASRSRGPARPGAGQKDTRMEGICLEFLRLSNKEVKFYSPKRIKHQLDLWESPSAWTCCVPVNVQSK